MITKCGILFLALACFAEIFALCSAQGAFCDSGWVYDSGSCYYREGTEAGRKNWNDAQNDCKSKGANLVTINSQAEMDFLTSSLLNSLGSWCGLKYQEDMDQFVWVSGEESDYTYWAINHPKIGKNRACVHLRLAQGSHKWETLNCLRIFRYSCEKPSLNTPCSSDPCKNGGTCNNEGNTYICQCPAGFTGVNCQTGLDPCDSSPCQNGGTCYSYEETEGVMAFYCGCPYGVGGDRCEKLLCDSYPCQNDGTCVESGDVTFCTCEAGYVGAVCEGVIPYITQNPRDAIRMEGDEVTFCCKAEGDPNPALAWFKDDILLDKAKYNYGSSLRIPGLTSGDAGLYKCRASNGFGKAFSDSAVLNVASGSGEDTCNPVPQQKSITLPEGCTSGGSSTLNVGTCSNEECVKSNQGNSLGCGSPDQKMCCSPIMTDILVTCGGGAFTFNTQRVERCECKPCPLPETMIYGTVVGTSNEPVPNALVTINGEKIQVSADRKGNFKIKVKSGVKRLVMTIKDPASLHFETSKVFNIQEGQLPYYTIVLQKQPPPKRFQATEKQNIPLGSEGGKPSYVDLDIPEEAFITEDGSTYTGEVTANLAVIDPRSEDDMAAAPGDFTAVDDNGEETILGTAGILRSAFTDNSGRKLNLRKNLTVTLDSEQLRIPDGVTLYQWYLDKQSGRWVKFGALRQQETGSRKKRQSRKFFVGTITAAIPGESINWDYVATVSYVRVSAPAGAVVTRISRSDDGSQATSYRQETVPSTGVLCILTIRDKPAYLQAEQSGSPLTPVIPAGIPAAVQAQIISQSGQTIYGVQTISFTSTNVDDSGPVYLKGEDGRCRQVGPSDLAFTFNAPVTPGQAFAWSSKGSNWYPQSQNRACFVKVVVSSSNVQPVIYVKSTGKGSGYSQDYGYTAGKVTSIPGSNQAMACLEFRCPTSAQAQEQTHLQVVTLTGTCSNMIVNSLLQQATCFISPDQDSTNEKNFCIPNDLAGGSAGVYQGDTLEALFRCQAGDNSYTGFNPPITVLRPSVTLTCS